MTARSETRQSVSAMQVDSETAIVGAISGTGLSRFSPSESSWLSATDYLASSGAHMPMSNARIMMGASGAITRGDFGGMTIAVTAEE
ncbi:hypothetical protein PHMEG_00030505 [Phytophthora megakarya]|uniref:Uncharacterized protein n=1 Tax=Phytophthora megakarya TaxID=4795 RepID=A0A225V0E4_9STRA|nr:hypothetical protein PHMEG_00030505 [Phytophthora megakarya]